MQPCVFAHPLLILPGFPGLRGPEREGRTMTAAGGVRGDGYTRGLYSKQPPQNPAASFAPRARGCTQISKPGKSEPLNVIAGARARIVQEKKAGTA